ncbi:TIGR03086 family metal-binding protein [Nonomuraea sp. NPDC050394]|uniref:TIGR03086 family metal-binding protein n=1 Tax=Nonomuraea sp. NPDC050394 TaxID=3364363 RepID=UPI00379658CB
MSAVLLERAVSYTLGSLVLVGPELLGNRTPCARWDLRALLDHMNDSLLALAEAADLGHVALRPTGCEGDPVAMLRRRACRLLGAWPTVSRCSQVAVGDAWLAREAVAGVGAIEVAVHGWDVAAACGHARPVPEPLAAALLDLALAFVDDDDRPHRFHAPVRPASPARSSDRLLAFLGRSA